MMLLLLSVTTMLSTEKETLEGKLNRVTVPTPSTYPEKVAPPPPAIVVTTPETTETF